MLLYQESSKKGQRVGIGQEIDYKLDEDGN